MPKVIIESKISYNGGKDNFKLKINNEKIEEIKSEGENRNWCRLWRTNTPNIQ